MARAFDRLRLRRASVVQQGMISPEHAAFVACLSSSAATP
jgi:hypothetical protein